MIVGRHLGIIRLVWTDEFQQGVDIAGRAKGCQEFGPVEFLGTEVMEHGAIVEQEFDIKDLDGFVASQDDAPAELEASRAFQFELMGTCQVVRNRGPEDAGGRLEVGQARAFLPVRHDLDQNFTQLGPAMGTDDDRLATLEVGRVRGEPTHLAPHAVSDQV
jgi:hypothetical protein